MKKITITFFAFLLILLILNSAVFVYKHYDKPMGTGEYVRNEINLAFGNEIDGVSFDDKTGIYTVNYTYDDYGVIYRKSDFGFDVNEFVFIKYIYVGGNGSNNRISLNQGWFDIYSNHNVNLINNTNSIVVLLPGTYENFQFKLMLSEEDIPYEDPYILDYYSDNDIKYYNELGRFGLSSIKTIFSYLVLIVENPIVLFFTETLPYLYLSILDMISPIVDGLNEIVDRFNDFFDFFPRIIKEIIDGLKFWE